MKRAWPFENTPEGGVATGRVETIEQFIAGRERLDAVVVRIGLNDAQLVVVADDGTWDRWVFHSVEEAVTAAADHGLEATVDEFPDDVRLRMNIRRRPTEEFDAAAYPEQGGVGPVIPYPENRPRQLDDPRDSKNADRP